MVSKPGGRLSNPHQRPAARLYGGTKERIKQRLRPAPSQLLFRLPLPCHPRVNRTFRAKALHCCRNSHIIGRAGFVPRLRSKLDTPSQERPFAVKIAVCIKQVPARDSGLRLNSTATWVQENDLSFEVNEPDIYALEEGLRLKEKHGGEVVLVTLGPARAQTALKEALAKGADRALHLDDPLFANLDA